MDNRPDSSTPRPLQTMPEHLNTAEKGLNENHAVIDEPKPFMPDLLTIPAISVKAGIQPVSLLENGQMDVPDNTEITGILFPGVLPGGKGNVIIDGHVDSYSGPAVFFKLKKLKQGDKVIVSSKTGRQLTYIVESVEAFTPAEAPMERIFGETGERRMNLITCTGRYSRKKKEHEKRLIIFTKLDGEL
ncbi:peptidase C60 sortase A and B [Paenibacillus riograndensis SBR5]|uniref:Peptidase C60 sortase A and B n=3 Tax=Paenibacillus riograndensis TaxID=483937 RepID=A0A0E3WHK4_9BACL|nr:peptidase C60 sortase A and B [Paenibacillus riograndensis SBR5]